MIRASALLIQRKQALSRFTHEHLISNLQPIQLGSEFALRDQFKEKFQFVLKRRGNNRVGTFDSLRFSLHSEGGVLSGLEGEWAAGIDADHPQILRKIGAFKNFSAVKLFVNRIHLAPRLKKRRASLQDSRCTTRVS